MRQQPAIADAYDDYFERVDRWALSIPDERSNEKLVRLTSLGRAFLVRHVAPIVIVFVAVIVVAVLLLW